MATYSVEALKAYFAQQVQEGHLAHAYLLTGGDITSKRAVITALAQDYFSRDSAGDPTTIRQRIADNQYADVYYLEAQGQTLKVDQVRELKEWLGQSPLEGRGKFAIIEQSERLNASSANALLTILEEPVANVYLFLWSPSANLLLPTILSRVQVLHLEAPDRQAQAADWEAHGVLPVHAQILAGFREETVARWTSDYEATQFEQAIKTWNGWYRQLVMGDPMAFVALQTRLKGDLTQQGGLDLADYCLRLTHQLLTKAAAYDFQGHFLTELAKQGLPSQADLLRLNQHLLEAKQRILANVSPHLALEQCVLRFKGGR